MSELAAAVESFRKYQIITELAQNNEDDACEKVCNAILKHASEAILNHLQSMDDRILSTVAEIYEPWNSHLKYQVKFKVKIAPDMPSEERLKISHAHSMYMIDNWFELLNFTILSYDYNSYEQGDRPDAQN